MISRGSVRYINLTTAAVGAGATTVELRPGAGKQWRIPFAVGFHTDAAGARNCVWHCVDTATAGPLNVDVAVAATTESLPLGANVANGQTLAAGPFKATYTRYYRFIFDASALGEDGFVYAVVEEFSGLVDA